MITPEEKDKVVAYIMSMDHISSSIFYKSVKGLNVTENEFYMILEQLDRMGLIKQFGGYSVTKRAELHDFVRRGGFVGQEELFKANIEKLNAELLVLSKELEEPYAKRIKMLLDISVAISTLFGIK